MQGWVGRQGVEEKGENENQPQLPFTEHQFPQSRENASAGRGTKLSSVKVFPID